MQLGIARWQMLTRLFAVVTLAAVVACGKKSADSPGQAEGESDIESDQDGSETGSGADSNGPNASGDSEPDDSAAAKGGGGSEAQAVAVVACNRMCDSVGKKCSQNDEQVCRATCEKYDVVPEECEAKAKEAFECGRTAKDLQCASVASPSCVDQFDDFAACATLGRKDKLTEYKAPVPKHWKRVTDAQAGFSVSMPPDAKLEEKDGIRSWVATDNDGVVYRASVRPAAGGGKNPDTALRTGVAEFLGECKKKQKVHSRWDKEEYSAAMFRGSCPDGTLWRGLARVAKGKIFALGLHASDDKKGAQEGFVHSFEFR